MKRILAVLFCLGFLAVAGAKSFALPVAGSKAITASVSPTGGVQVWDATVKKIIDNVATGALGWGPVTAGTPGYKVADQYIEVTATITNPITWKMLIYTNNAAYTGDKSLGGFGLVNSANNRGLPLAWCVKESTQTVGSPALPFPKFSTKRVEDGKEGFEDFMWKFLVDMNQTDADGLQVGDGSYGKANALKYNRVWDNNGFYWNEGVKPAPDPSPAPSLDNKIFIYVAAEFTRSMAELYSTNTLTLETLLGL